MLQNAQICLYLHTKNQNMITYTLSHAFHKNAISTLTRMYKIPGENECFFSLQPVNPTNPTNKRQHTLKALSKRGK